MSVPREVSRPRSAWPALGGFVVAAAGPGFVFVLNALSFLGVVAVLLRWRRSRSPNVLPAEHMLGAIRSGLRYARHSSALRRVLLGAFLFMVCGAGIMALMPVLGQRRDTMPSYSDCSSVRSAWAP